MTDWDTTEPREVDVLQGASLLLRRSLLDRIGVLDGDYFMYSEEVDLCLRIQRAGWRLYWVPQSQVIHYDGQSTRQAALKMFLQLYASKLRYFRKHHGRFAGFLYKLSLAKAALIRLALTPLILLQPAAQREQQFTLACYYWRLLVALPRM